MSHDTHVAQPERRVYRLQTSQRRMLIICAVIFFLMSLLPLPLVYIIFAGPPLPVPRALPIVFGILAMGLFLASAIIALFGVFHTKMILSNEGIEFRDVFGHCATTWDNIERLGVVGGAEALLLREPIGKKGKFTHIHLQKFGEHWGNSELARDLRRFAPHLFEKA